jgi:hypothetical protein
MALASNQEQLGSCLVPHPSAQRMMMSQSARLEIVRRAVEREPIEHGNPRPVPLHLQANRAQNEARTLLLGR